MKLAIAVLTIALGAIPVAQSSEVRALFENGQYEGVVDAVGGMENPDPGALYKAALSYQKLSRGDEAQAAFSRLASRDGEDPWRSIGESGRLLAEGNAQEALAPALRAVELAPTLAEGSYQAGLVYGQLGDFSKAAAAFEKAVQVDPGSAYAHYHAGLAHYRARRVDMMATHFETFLRLAPEAPERGEVESIMRTLRGR